MCCDTHGIADGPDMWHRGLFICQRSRLGRVKQGVNRHLSHMLRARRMTFICKDVLDCFVLYFIFNIMAGEKLRKCFCSGYTRPALQIAFISINKHRLRSAGTYINQFY